MISKNTQIISGPVLWCNIIYLPKLQTMIQKQRITKRMKNKLSQFNEMLDFFFSDICSSRNSSSFYLCVNEIRIFFWLNHRILRKSNRKYLNVIIREFFSECKLWVCKILKFHKMWFVSIIKNQYEYVITFICYVLSLFQHPTQHPFDNSVSGPIRVISFHLICNNEKCIVLYIVWMKCDQSCAFVGVGSI